MNKCDVSLQVNGEAHTVSVYPMERLLDVLRTKIGLTGTKEGCGEGECGSCSVLMNGELVNRDRKSTRLNSSHSSPSRMPSSA